tara:strand:- start:1864 stop:2043 length:180 start_codon:yes stop_codon:yes gene_type:complete
MSKDPTDEFIEFEEKLAKERGGTRRSDGMFIPNKPNKSGCMSLYTILIIVILFTIQFAF